MQRRDNTRFGLAHGAEQSRVDRRVTMQVGMANIALKGGATQVSC